MNARYNSGTSACTLCKNLAKIGPVSSVENRLERANCVATPPQFDDRLSFGTLAYRNGLEYRNSDFSKFIRNHCVEVV